MNNFINHYDQYAVVLRQNSKKNNAKMPKKNLDIYRIFDDQTIEGLMRYYKLDTPDALLKYIKRNGIARDDIFKI